MSEPGFDFNWGLPEEETEDSTTTTAAPQPSSTTAAVTSPTTEFTSTESVFDETTENVVESTTHSIFNGAEEATKVSVDHTTPSAVAGDPYGAAPDTTTPAAAEDQFPEAFNPTSPPAITPKDLFNETLTDSAINSTTPRAVDGWSNGTWDDAPAYRDFEGWASFFNETAANETAGLAPPVATDATATLPAPHPDWKKFEVLQDFAFVILAIGGLYYFLVCLANVCEPLIERPGRRRRRRRPSADAEAIEMVNMGPARPASPSGPRVRIETDTRGTQTGAPRRRRPRRRPPPSSPFSSRRPPPPSPPSSSPTRARDATPPGLLRPIARLSPAPRRPRDSPIPAFPTARPDVEGHLGPPPSPCVVTKALIHAVAEGPVPLGHRLRQPGAFKPIGLRTASAPSMAAPPPPPPTPEGCTPGESAAAIIEVSRCEHVAVTGLKIETITLEDSSEDEGIRFTAPSRKPRWD